MAIHPIAVETFTPNHIFRLRGGLRGKVHPRVVEKFHLGPEGWTNQWSILLESDIRMTLESVPYRAHRDPTQSQPVFSLMSTLCAVILN